MFLKLKMKSLSGLKDSHHLFLLTWLLVQQVTGLTELSNLNMAPDAFDDQYEGCVEEMEKKAPELLMKDFNMSRQLKLEWERAGQKWEKIKTRMSYPKGFHDFHGTALVAYTGDIHKDFNGAVREFKKNPGNFHYRAFHYYLTRALQLLSNQNCYSVYRGTKDRFHYSGKGSVRFGQFASSSLEKEVALKNFSGAAGTLYTINTCLGVYIKAFSYFPREEEVLIPAYEVYHKVSVTRSGEGYDKISLDSPRREKSNFNCFYSGSTETGARNGCAFLLLVMLPGLLVWLLPLVDL
uniref:T-cell ecto-ADP-ribosyltransferase 2-like n=1 Tax=Myodes glareolus TaxID=447135 RepID=UPI0020224039|nr:T-cell ecto-ADP-ribosyltransferase 2-like [Myodes glareolus]